MSERTTGCESFEWLPGIKKICSEFYESLQKRPGRQFLCFDESFLGTIENRGIILKDYEKSVIELKEIIFGIENGNEHIDYHKIAACL